jgi:hypothetical protein
MSQENVEAFERAVEASNGSDYDALLAEFDPEVEWHGVMGVIFGPRSRRTANSSVADSEMLRRRCHRG